MINAFVFDFPTFASLISVKNLSGNIDILLFFIGAYKIDGFYYAMEIVTLPFGFYFLILAARAKRVIYKEHRISRSTVF